MGRSAEALKTYRAFMRYAPPEASSYTELAQERVQAMERSPKETPTTAKPVSGPPPKEHGNQNLAEVDRNLERHPEDWQALFQKAELLDKAGKKSEALDAYKTFLTHCPPQARLPMIQAMERIRALER